MEFQEYMKIKKRMCKSDKDGCCTINCYECYLCGKNKGSNLSCRAFELLHPEEAEKILIKWAEEHPVKTRKQDLLEKYPNAQLYEESKRPVSCAQNLGYINYCCDDCKKCWDEPVEE